MPPPVPPAPTAAQPSLMLDSWVTPLELFFIRHHHPVPVIEYLQHRLELKGLGVKRILLDMEDLKKRFPRSEVVATLQCGGNRRSGFDTISKTSGISWGFGAMSTARYGGVLLRDVLLYAGLLHPETADEAGARHVQFRAVDGLSASIPIEKALSPYGDVLLAYEMNGEPLPPEHGGDRPGAAPTRRPQALTPLPRRQARCGSSCPGTWASGTSSGWRRLK